MHLKILYLNKKVERLSEYNLKDRMLRFSVDQLKNYLGHDIIDSLLEWNTNNDRLQSKANLSDMIMCIHGVSILKNKEFRSQIIKTFDIKDIESFDQYLPKVIRNLDDINKKVEYISGKPWKESDINNHLLKLLGFDSHSVFEKKVSYEQIKKAIESYAEFYELLDYQYIIRQQALNILNSDFELSRFLIHMPTGTGKTKTATHIICHHYNYNLKKQGLIIWIAHTTELLEQAYSTFNSVWKNIGNGSINVYRFWGKHDEEIFNTELLGNTELSGFMVCSIQKLQSISSNNQNLMNKLIKDTRLIVFDEAHKASAKETRQIIEKFMTRKGGLKDRALMGLSATPGKTTTDSFDNQLLVSLFGNKIIEINTRLMNAVNMSIQEAINSPVETDVIKYFQDRGVLSKIKKEELEYDEQLTEDELRKISIVANANGYDDFSKKSLEQIGKNKSRNLKILQRLRELNRAGKPTIVFACSVQHGQLLSAMLTLERIENALIIGEMSPYERAESIRRFKDRNDKLNIIINYEVLTTGFDSTNIECVFIARPTQSVVLYSQMLGRGLRGPRMGGNEECLLIDIKDNLKQYNEHMAFSHFSSYWNLKE